MQTSRRSSGIPPAANKLVTSRVNEPRAEKKADRSLPEGSRTKRFSGQGRRLACRAETAEARKETVRPGDVARDLRFQFFGVCEFSFLAQAFPKTNLDPFGCKLFGRVEQMRFDGQGSAVERGPHANVGHGAAAFRFAIEHRAGDVNAASGQKFLLGLKIQRRNREAMADAFAGNDRAGENERAPEQPAGTADVAVGYFAAKNRAADNFSAIDHRRHHDHFKSEAFAHLLE